MVNHLTVISLAAVRDHMVRTLTLQLHAAILRGDHESIKISINSGDPVGREDGSGNTALHLLAQSRKVCYYCAHYVLWALCLL